MAEHDLTQRLSPFLDKHMVFPLLEYLQESKLFPDAELLSAKLALLEKTSMLDFAGQTYTKLHGKEAPAEYAARREAVVAGLADAKEATGPLLQLCNSDASRELHAAKSWNAAVLAERHGVTAGNIAALRRYAKLQYECGSYDEAASLLAEYRPLAPDAGSASAALWGKLAADILMGNWDAAMHDVQAVADAIEDHSNGSSPLLQLQQRTWLMHWSLFVFFKHANGRTTLVDLWLNDRYVNALQTRAPHLLRYLTLAVVTSKRRRIVLKDLMRLLTAESHHYTDPVTEFVLSLYVEFDFDQAEAKLKLCRRLVANDYFLHECQDDFAENARLFIFETYCRIHQRIDIGTMAAKLGMEGDAAEKWIVNLIRNARLDAKIDSANNHVLMNSQTPELFQQVIEKTKGLAFRSTLLNNNIDKRLYDIAQGIAPAEPIADQRFGRDHRDRRGYGGGGGRGGGGRGGGGRHHHHRDHRDRRGHGAGR